MTPAGGQGNRLSRVVTSSLSRLRRRAPTITAVIGHADDADLLERSVRHHLSVGIDHILIVFCRDDAESLQLAGALEEDGRVRSMEIYSDTPTSFELFNLAITPVLEWTNPDWILFLDTDEFCIPASGRIGTTVGLSAADVVTIERFNMPLVRAGDGTLRDPLATLPDPDRLLMISGRQKMTAQSLEESPGLGWISANILPKVMARPGVIERVSRGGHEILSPPGKVRHLQPRDLILLHAPFTTPERFCRKVGAIRDLLARRGDLFKPGQAWHWKRWLQLDESGGLTQEFEQQAIAEEDVPSLIAKGVLGTPAGYFAGRKPSP